MKCTKVNELLLTYIDGALDHVQTQEIAEHLKECSACKKLEDSLKETLQPFHAVTQHIEAPATLWPNIKAAILVKQHKKSTVEVITDWINPLWLRRGAPIAVAASVILFVSVFFTQKYIADQKARDASLGMYLEEQMLFYSQLDKKNKYSLWDVANAKFNTSIENFLL
jgi:anti-sigma factor RsiW